MAQVLVDCRRIHLDGVPAAAGLVADGDFVIGSIGGVPAKRNGEGNDGRGRHEDQDDGGHDEGEGREAPSWQRWRVV